jgi:hypothetical protein
MRKQQYGDTDLLWGAQAIGAEINRSPSQVYYLHRTGALKGAVRKLTHKILVGSKSRLKELAFDNPNRTI